MHADSLNRGWYVYCYLGRVRHDCVDGLRPRDLAFSYTSDLRQHSSAFAAGISVALAVVFIIQFALFHAGGVLRGLRCAHHHRLRDAEKAR